MTNKEKCEHIRNFSKMQDVDGIMALILLDDSYKSIDFAKYVKNFYPDLFVGVNDLLISKLEEYNGIVSSCVALLHNESISLQIKNEIAERGAVLAKKNIAIAQIAKEMCITFKKAI